MTKTNTKLTEVITTEESPSYKRQRMLEVRQIVANAVKNNQRVDQLGFTGTDIARSQIALQDLLDKERQKHSRARHHILNLKDDTMFLSDVMQMTQTGMMMIISDLSAKVLHQDKMLNAAHDECFRLASGWHDAMKSQYEMQTENAALKTSLKVALRDAV
ncbi:hypothetical protein [Silicibacter phage DSS3phi2]|uniref:Uncharacterized protein n=5 Tax=Aorunvirus V12 TaxID=2846074 RepID=A0A2Z4QGC5_9CAUD|nr:hypothetical protein DSS3P2_gp25 [Silicibacter phage DSS3phi2]YP_009880429.1 hypothetical protein HYP62_gp26 [Ruegeria phage vB_RpoP-V12]AWY08984.1 hypothetical protein vBRpoPV21_26 [Ruegeria phage vB_RpoP-V21]AWY09545.1 hypothetical protein vBRpoPV17_26 [Ruegeria phage vB_RpoP-V17]AXF42146.1 hypothetical protein vBRpoPV14_28 [Ruegeria phage vB_RpoP-V14]ACL81293.1 hypothetical protein [Silicibacter phage DSS3phi2]AWY08813.1 hypothetical protein vBRpoPV12_26 [Ruegeria phage vB_RpoP-V12]